MNNTPLYICTANIQGAARHHDKLLPYYTYVSAHPHSIYVLTETNLDHLRPLMYPPPENLLTAHFTRDESKSVGSGVALLLGNSITTSAPPTTLIAGYLIHVNILYQQRSIDVYAVYSSPAGATIPLDAPLLSHIIHTITSHAQARSHAPNWDMIVVGDLNAAFRSLDKSVPARSKTAHDRHWRRLCTDLSLVDAVSAKHPTTSLYTLMRPNHHSTPDHILLSPSLSRSLDSVYITTQNFLKQGDHTPLHARLNPPSLTVQSSLRGKHAINRVPLLHLHDPLLRTDVQAAIHSWPQPTEDASPQAVWSNFQGLTALLSAMICRYSTRIARSERQQVRFLQKQLQRIHQTRPTTPLATLAQLDQKRLCESQLNALNKLHLKRKLAFLNERTELDLPALCPLLYAHAARKLQDVDSHITSLKHPSTGTLHQDLPGQLDAAHVFYSGLLNRPFVPTNATFTDTDYDTLLNLLPRLTPDQQISLKAPPTATESLALLRRLKPHKAPGPDGLASDFYREFAESLTPHFHRVLLCFHATGYVPSDVKLGIVKPFYKGNGSDRTDLANWRPITLLNTTYKLLALYLGTRLTPLLPHLISPGQTSNVPGRTCISNVHAVSLAMAIASLKRVDSVFLFLDSEKAFDNVNWPFLWDTLAAYGIPRDFIALCTALYTDAHVFINVNGYLTPPIALGNGVRQGCPASPILYILYLEPIRLVIEKFCPPSVRNWLPNATPTSYAHADDLAIITDLATVPPLLRALALLQPRSGLKINPLKSVALLFSRSNSPLPAAFPVPLHNVLLYPHTYLGIVISGPKPDNATSLIATTRISRKLNSIGTSRHLPLFSRATRIQSASAGGLQYHMQAAHFTSAQTSKLTIQMRRAFYGVTDANRSKERWQFIDQDRLFLPRKLGGTGLHDLARWQVALNRRLIHSLCHAITNPLAPVPSAAPVPRTILLRALLALLAARLRINRDVRTFFWWPETDYRRITRRLPLFWCKAFNAHLASRPAATTLQLDSTDLDALYFTSRFTWHPPLQLPARAHDLGIDVAVNDHIHELQVDPLPDVWLTYINHPAYFMHMPSSHDPTAPGSLVRHYYQHDMTARAVEHIALITPAREWSPHLRPRGQLSIPSAHLSTVTVLFAGPRPTDDVRDFAFKLYQRRYQPAYFSCPYCGRKPPPTPHTAAQKSLNFNHTSWGCRSLQTRWRRLATQLQLPTPRSLLPIALGIDVDMQPVDPIERLHSAVLLTTLWDHRQQIRHLWQRSKQQPLSETERLACAADSQTLDAILYAAYHYKLQAQTSMR